MLLNKDYLKLIFFNIDNIYVYIVINYIFHYIKYLHKSFKDLKLVICCTARIFGFLKTVNKKGGIVYCFKVNQNYILEIKRFL